MALVGFLLSVLAIALVIAMVIFSSKPKTPTSMELPGDRRDNTK